VNVEIVEYCSTTQANVGTGRRGAKRLTRWWKLPYLHRRLPIGRRTFAIKPNDVRLLVLRRRPLKCVVGSRRTSGGHAPIMWSGGLAVKLNKSRQLIQPIVPLAIDYASVLIFREFIVRIAVHPALARLGGCDHGMAGGICVLGGMAIRRIVATKRRPALLTGP